MWVERTEGEVGEFVRGEKRSNRNTFLGIAVAISLAFGVCHGFGIFIGRRIVLVSGDNSWSGIRFFVGFLLCLLVCFFCYFVAFVINKIFKSSFDDSFTICPQCSAASRYNDDAACECGGTFRRISRYK